MIQINGELALEIALQFVTTSPGKTSHDGQRRCGLQFSKTLLYELRSPRTMGAYHLFFCRKVLLEFLKVISMGNESKHLFNPLG